MFPFVYGGRLFSTWENLLFYLTIEQTFRSSIIKRSLTFIHSVLRYIDFIAHRRQTVEKQVGPKLSRKVLDQDWIHYIDTRKISESKMLCALTS